MTVKTKISKEKRRNQKRNKQKNKNVKKTSKKGLPSKIPAKQPSKPVHPEEDSDENHDVFDMLEDDDVTFLKSAVANKSYNLLRGIHFESEKSKSRNGVKRKNTDEDEENLEEDYENQPVIENSIELKNLLPIKSKGKVIPQVGIVEEQKEEDDDSELEEIESEFENDNNEEDIDMEEEIEIPKTVSTATLLATHAETLNNKKIQIGSLCAGVLENPDEKIDNLKTVMKMLDENLPEVFLTVRKIVIVSLQEVFKDILPSFQIQHHDIEGKKLKKDTLSLQKHESTLLVYYKNFLKKLEKFMYKLMKKKGNTQKTSVEEQELGLQSLQTMCDLLISHPYFNFSENIAQAVLPFLTHQNKSLRLIVNSMCKTIFKEDKKGEITLKIVRIVNQLLKKSAHKVNTEMLEIFLHLKIKDVNLDQEKEDEMKHKKLMSHKKRVLQLSKREKKKKKQLEMLEKELLETKAEENKKTKHQNLTEITKVVFGVCFRILKTSKNTKMLGIALEILSKYAHCINLDFYVDLVNTLNLLLQEDWLSHTERLHCIKTVFSILGGQGEALTLDPSFLYVILYRDILTFNASSKNHRAFALALEALTEALIKRRKKVTNNRMIGFTKRLTTLGLQLLHNGTLGALSMVKTLLQHNSFLDVLLDLDPSLGDGIFQPEIEDPEYCNAATTALYETVLLGRHYHPVVKKIATCVAHGAPSTGESSLDYEISKCTPEEFFNSYDMSEMAFNPSVPVPKKITDSKKILRHVFVNSEFEKYCSEKSKFPDNCRGIFV